MPHRLAEADSRIDDDPLSRNPPDRHLELAAQKSDDIVTSV